MSPEMILLKVISLILYIHHHFCTINHFTRVTHSTRSAIDNIITNIRNTRLESGVVLFDMTDHFPIVLILDFASKTKLPRQKKTTKVLNERTLQYIAYDNLINEITNSICCAIPEKTENLSNKINQPQGISFNHYLHLTMLIPFL